MKRSFLVFSILFFEFNTCPVIYSQDLKGDHSGGTIPATDRPYKMENIHSTDRANLTEVYNECGAGLNYVQTSWSVTSRYIAGSSLPANFSVAGIPATATVIKAFAWWVVSFQSGSSSAPIISITAPDLIVHSYIATMAGQHSPKCWGEQGTRTFRADITSVITENGSYVCNITGNTVWEIDGITILVVYADSTDSKHGHLIIRDGCLTSLNNPVIQPDFITNFNACLNSDYASVFAITSDQQNNVTPPTHLCVFNGNTTLFPNTFWNFDSDTTTITSGQDSCSVSIIPNPTDCWTWAVSGLYYRTDSCSVCVIQSIDEAFGKIAVSIYPNPAASEIIIRRNTFSVASLELVDCFGRKVFERYLTSDIQHLTVDVSNFSSGLYFVKLSDEKNSIMKKLLIQH